MRREGDALEQQLRFVDGVVFELPSAGRRVDGGGPGKKMPGCATRARCSVSEVIGTVCAPAFITTSASRTRSINLLATISGTVNPPVAIGAFGEGASLEVGRAVRDCRSHAPRPSRRGASCRRPGRPDRRSRRALQPGQHALFGPQHGRRGRHGLFAAERRSASPARSRAARCAARRRAAGRESHRVRASRCHTSAAHWRAACRGSPWSPCRARPAPGVLSQLHLRREAGEHIVAEGAAVRGERRQLGQRHQLGLLHELLNLHHVTSNSEPCRRRFSISRLGEPSETYRPDSASRRPVITKLPVFKRPVRYLVRCPSVPGKPTGVPNVARSCGSIENPQSHCRCAARPRVSRAMSMRLDAVIDVHRQIVDVDVVGHAGGFEQLQSAPGETPRPRLVYGVRVQPSRLQERTSAVHRPASRRRRASPRAPAGSRRPRRSCSATSAASFVGSSCHRGAARRRRSRPAR